MQADPRTPDWKLLWDEARNFVRAKQYDRAAASYSELYRRKPNIEEAVWEYCKVLLKVENYDGSEKIIGELLEKQPRRSDYLLAGAKVALHNKNYSAAISYYGRVFEKDPAGESADEALRGLAESLRSSGQKELSLPLLEQLLQRQPGSRDLIHKLAVDSYELGRAAKARVYYSMLLEYPDVEDRIVFQAAELFDEPGFQDVGSGLWRTYLERHPDYLPFHYKLADYYQRQNEFEKALRHLAYLADHSTDSSQFLMRAGNLCLRQLNRPDKALEYFERYRRNYPEDPQIQKTISEIESILANDFLAIVENDGAWTLWRDLAEVAPNRLAIYLEMADLLEQQGKIKELVEILTIIHKHSPDNNQVAMRLGSYFYQVRRYDQALHYLATVSENTRTKNFYLLRGKSQIRMGLELDGLDSFEKALQFDPADVSLRKRCLELAGGIGMVDREQQLFAEGKAAHRKKLPYELVAVHLEMLSYNYLFHEYETVVKWAQEFFAHDPWTIATLTLRRAITLRKKGSDRRAEQLLRQLVHGDQLVDETLFTLAENAVSDKNFAAAGVWKRALRQEYLDNKTASAKHILDLRLTLLKLQQLKGEGDYEEALTVIEEFRKETVHSTGETVVPALMNRLEKERCLLYYHTRNFRQALAIAGHLVNTPPFDPEIITLYQILSRKTGQQEKETINGILYAAGRPVASTLIAVAEQEVKYRRFNLAQEYIQKVLSVYPNSVVANAILADLNIASSHLENASFIFGFLAEKFPRESFFHQRLIEIEVKNGRYDHGLELLGDKGGGENDLRFDFSSLSGEHIEQKLLLARLLWGNKQQEKALQIYQQLLAPAVVDLLGEKFRQKKIDHLSLTREHTFWNSMMLLLQSEPEIVAELMEPQFLIKNRGSEAGKVVVDFFERYSWQKLINTEFLARTASYNRNYRFAEQSYRRLLEEEDSTEGMRDLATIYSRIGEYRKEAQVYEAMQSSGTTTPDLADSIERTSLQLSPQNSIEGSYQEKTGRDGYIDIATTSVGTSFWFTPDLDKDFTIRYAYNTYDSVDAEDKTESNLVYGAGIWEFSPNSALRIGGGGEKLDSEGGAETLYDIKLDGQLDAYVDSYILYERKPVYDTVAAVKEHIFYQAIETGLNIETSFGIAFGGDLWHRNYNDGNAQNRLHGYSSYTVFGDSLYLVFRYDYQYLTNEDENDPTGADGVQLYWSPSSYDEHRLSLHFQHDFLGYEEGVKRGISYYSVDGAVGFEDNDTISYTGLFDIFLEISPHFLLKGNFTLSKSDVYEETGLSLSLHYRW